METTVDDHESSEQEFAVKSSMFYSLRCVVNGEESVTGLPLALPHTNGKFTPEGDPDEIFILLR